MKKPFKIYWVDPGFCRIIYVCRNAQNERVFYGIYQEAENSFQLYRLCQQLEPQNVAHAKKPLIELFEIPDGNYDYQLELDIAEFIIKN